jgi:putative holliday junction resolvase
VIAANVAGFRDALPGGGRLIALDVGTKTIGIAYCDAGWAFASPGSLIERTKFAADLARLREAVGAQSVKGIVIGLPLNMDGSDSARTQSVRAFARNVDSLGLPILLWDERWSTQAVERAMVDADVSRAKRSARVDNAAAAFILQGAIDALTMQGGTLGGGAE